MIKILKKNGVIQDFDGNKIISAIERSAERVCIKLSEEQKEKVVNTIQTQLQYNETEIPVSTIHNMVEVALDTVEPAVAKSYR